MIVAVDLGDSRRTGSEDVLVIGLEAGAVLVLAAVHLFAGRLRFLDVIPRSRWLSMAGGSSVAYVFLHVFPELRAAHAELSAEGSPLRAFQDPAYLLALLGLIVFYGLERVVRASQHGRAGQPPAIAGETTVSPAVFWLHLSSFTLYNGLIAYLITRGDQAGRELLFFVLAMGLHFLVNDYGMRQDHKRRYQELGRWILASALLVGWLLGQVVVLPSAATAALFAFLAGGVILNVLKEELPEERQSRFSAFALGAFLFAVLLSLA